MCTKLSSKDTVHTIHKVYQQRVRTILTSVELEAISEGSFALPTELKVKHIFFVSTHRDLKNPTISKGGDTTTSKGESVIHGPQCRNFKGGQLGSQNRTTPNTIQQYHVDDPEETEINTMQPP